MKKVILNGEKLKMMRAAAVVGFVLVLIVRCMALDGICDGIRSNVLRLHIIANSDSESDQELKLRVRDRLLEEGRLYLKGAADEKEAESLAAESLSALEAAANDEVRKNGYDYPVNVSLGPAEFGTRVYDDITLPAGKYEALRVVIGSGEGKNWWCVMFPPMCVPVAEEDPNAATLDDILEDDQSELVSGGQKYRVKFKSVEIFERVKEKIEKWL